jgi:hypothetical protein
MTLHDTNPSKFLIPNETAVCCEHACSVSVLILESRARAKGVTFGSAPLDIERNQFNRFYALIVIELLDVLSLRFPCLVLVQFQEHFDGLLLRHALDDARALGQI